MRRNMKTFKMENLYKKHKKDLIKLDVRCSGSHFYFTCVTSEGQKWTDFRAIENIYLTNNALSKQCLGWHNFGCFKKITYVYVLQLDGKLYFFLEPEKLLNKTKLKSFVEGQQFQKGKYAFINYDLYRACYEQLVSNKKAVA